MDDASYPVTFSVEYPDRPLDRLSTLFRLFAAIPIWIVLSTVSGGSWRWGVDNRANDAGVSSTVVVVGAAGGILFLAPMLMILVRQKYPRWWFDWNLELLRFGSRVAVYRALMDDRYPSTDDHQSVNLDYPYPDVPNELNRWLPLVRWLLAIPHYIALIGLFFAAFFAVVAAWFAILITGTYPRGLFHFVEGVFRWQTRVVGYAVTLVTDRYPPFRLAP